MFHYPVIVQMYTSQSEVLWNFKYQATIKEKAMLLILQWDFLYS